MEAADRRDPVGRDRRAQRRAGETVSRRGRGHRLRRHRHHAQRRPGGARARMDRRHAAGVNPKLPIALTIAGSDSGGGAGIQADLKTFAALGVYGASAITAITAQNTRGVRAIHYPPPAIVVAQIEAVLADLAVAAIKIGMLGSPEIVGAVVGTLLAGEGRAPFIVYDPVMIASSGPPLSGASFVETVRASLLP